MKPVFVTIDGAKATGKTTLMVRLDAVLGRDLRVRRLAEKDLDPGREETRRLLAVAGRNLSPQVDFEVACRLAVGRQAITASLEAITDVDVVLMDRWVPSEAALRRHVPFADCLAENERLGVRRPDLVLALHCEAPVSWDRAQARARGLDSLVIHGFDDHVTSCRTFLAAARQYGWTVIDNSGALEHSVDAAVAAIRTCIDSHPFPSQHAGGPTS